MIFRGLFLLWQALKPALGDQFCWKSWAEPEVSCSENEVHIQVHSRQLLPEVPLEEHWHPWPGGTAELTAVVMKSVVICHSCRGARLEDPTGKGWLLDAFIPMETEILP